MSNTTSGAVEFRDLGLASTLLTALDEIGYETPTQIQIQAIPHLLNGLDLLGRAPTGTGKTAAFALPLLSRIEPKATQVQILTLTPTRELAIQVAEAFKRYAAGLKDFRVLPIYGGQEYGSQIRQLKRGVQVVVGTPGRLMDHMRKGTLKLDGVRALVLDEADEMLRMGFIEEVEWILEQTPAGRQTALFSATMPREIERIARRHLNDPKKVQIEARIATAETIRQRFWPVSGLHKLDALTRILEVEPFDGILVFVRTKTATAEIASRLEARGFAAAALNGDMVQRQREQMVERLKKGSLDILVATDVAARGLDVDRVSHVVNYDIPYDAEVYIHRIGRTGRAGRTGEAILFVAPREQRMLRTIEKVTKQKLERLELPTTEAVNNTRIAKFKQSISDTLAAGELAFAQNLVEQFRQEHNVPAVDIAAALARMCMGDKPLLLEKEKPRASSARSEEPSARPRHLTRRPKPGWERYRIEVGASHGVQPKNIVGAIANEAGLDGEHIAIVQIDDDHSLVDLPEGMPRDVFRDLKKTRVCGEALAISRSGSSQTKGEKGSKPKKRKPPVRGKKSTKPKARAKPKTKPKGKRKPKRTDTAG